MIETYPLEKSGRGLRAHAERQGAIPCRSNDVKLIQELKQLAAMGEAFDTACKELHCAGPSEVVHELIAKRIIASAVQVGLIPVGYGRRR